MGEVALTPCEFEHTAMGLEQLTNILISLGGDIRAVMETTGRCHEPVAAALHEAGMAIFVITS